ncbi:uncharacterized [Tachysurus ichikawai]
MGASARWRLRIKLRIKSQHLVRSEAKAKTKHVIDPNSAVLRLEWGAELSKHSACQLNRRSGRELQALPRPSASLVEGGGGETARRGVQTPSDLGGPGCPISLRASVVPKTGACVESRRPAAWLSQKEGCKKKFSLAFFKMAARHLSACHGAEEGSKIPDGTLFNLVPTDARFDSPIVAANDLIKMVVKRGLPFVTRGRGRQAGRGGAESSNA